MKVKILLNPYSNRWNAHKLWHKAGAALKPAGVDFDLDGSEQAGADDYVGGVRLDAAVAILVQ